MQGFGLSRHLYPLAMPITAIKHLLTRCMSWNNVKLITNRAHHVQFPLARFESFKMKTKGFCSRVLARHTAMQKKGVLSTPGSDQHSFPARQAILQDEGAFTTIFIWITTRTSISIIQLYFRRPITLSAPIHQLESFLVASAPHSFTNTSTIQPQSVLAPANSSPFSLQTHSTVSRQLLSTFILLLSASMVLLPRCKMRG